MEVTVTTVLGLQSKVSEMGSHVLTGLFSGKTGTVTCDLSTDDGKKYQISVTSKRMYAKKKTTKKVTAKRTTTKKKKTSVKK